MADFSHNFRPRRDQQGPREMFKAVCSNCGKDCEVPFKPSSDKPVYCSDCFKRNRAGSNPPKALQNGGQPRTNEREQFSMLNSKLDKILAILNSNTPVIVPQEPVVVPEVAEKKKRVSKRTTPTPEEPIS